MFNLWIKAGYLEEGETRVSYERKSKVRRTPHKVSKPAKTGLVSLKFIEDLAAQKRIYFTPYEKAILKVIIFDKRERLLSRKGGTFLDKLRDMLLEIALMRLNKVKLELEEWTTPNPAIIKTYMADFDGISIEMQLKGIKELDKLRKDIALGKTRILPDALPTPNNVAYHLIHILPLTLVIKIFRMYFPFFVADEFLREKFQEVESSLHKLVNNRNSVATFKGVKIIEKDKMKLKRINLLKSIMNEYLKYKKQF